MHRCLRFLAAIMFYALLLCGTAAAEPEKLFGDCVDVVDGDTIRVGVWRFDPDTRRWDQEIRVVRLNGIDAPELSQDYGIASREYLAKRIEGKRIEVYASGRDWFGRTLGDVFLIDFPYTMSAKLYINSDMVVQGCAWWYRKFAPTNKLLEFLESCARENKIGLWQRPAIAPWEFRQKKLAGHHYSQVRKRRRRT